MQRTAHGTLAYAQSTADSTATFHAESRLVLVDTVVTDKKGNYVRDLEQKDFKVWEDGKEQPITSFSYEENTGSTPAAKPRYMVLFFDNSTMEFGDQAKAREAATKFIEANAGPHRLIAIAEFGGTVTITQNFTSDADRLKQVVAGIKGSAVSPNPEPTMASLGPPAAAMPSLSNAEADFGVHTALLALRDLARGMSNVPGRKTLVMLTAGFPLTPEYESEITATIDTCNKANVAIYPIDVRGLVAPVPGGPHSRLQSPSFPYTIPYTSSFLVPAAFHLRDNQPALKFAAFAAPVPHPAQHGVGGGGGSGGGHGGGGTGGSGGHGGGTGTGGTGGGHSGSGGSGGTTGTGRS
ncbi:MAG: VWA domain-containing protein, partial [Candidatus Sulfotelmatobacter sp.]